ncbi:MAG: hypothetical protein J6A23_14295 [Thermoguttaceae bacterium]|nr:hypothetical protein [Thermoguttaceae bacterium]
MITPPSANSPRYSSHLLHQRRWRASAFINSVTSITHKNPNGTQIVQHSYTYDETNNIVEYLNSIDGQTSYDYDFLGQLVSADHTGQTDESYIYDSNGNRITANGATYTTGTNNELTSDGDYTYTYDAEGNRTSKTNSAGTERELYTWDYCNRLTTVTKQTYDTTTATWTTIQIVEYAYDYNNVWIRKVVGNDKTIFIPENYQTTVQIDNNAVTHHYLWTPNQQDKLLTDTTSTDVLWSLTDHLGTIRDILGDTSTHLTYDAFGNLTSGTNPLLFGFTGKAFDTDTNLQNNINRWYDALIGRWLSVDPIGFEGNDTNLYRYVENNSLLRNDILGLFPTWEQLYAAAPESIQKAMEHCKCMMEGYEFLLNSQDSLTESEFYAFLASFAVYQSDKNPFGGYLRGMRYKDPKSGLSYGIYEYAPGKTILVFTGTDERIDWEANIRQGIGDSSAPQYDQLGDLLATLQIRPTLITGHSLGGGLATIAAIRPGRPEALIALNPAAPNSNVVKRIEQLKLDSGLFDMTDAKAVLATSWVVDGDILTALQRPLRGSFFINIGQVKKIQFAQKPLFGGDRLNHSACFFLYYALTAPKKGL